MIIQICEKCDRFYMVHNANAILKSCPNCKNEDLGYINGDAAHIWYLEGKLKVVKGQLALTEKALELACERVKYFEELQDKEMGHFEFFGYDSDYDLQAIIEQYKEQAKEQVWEKKINKKKLK